MKKTILTLLIVVMVSTPCLAEVKTESLFSVEGTLWGMYGISFTSYPPFFSMRDYGEIVFYEGMVIILSDNEPVHYTSSYNDLGVVSFAYYIAFPDPEHVYQNNFSRWFFAIMQPNGLGVFSWIEYQYGGCVPFYGCYPPTLLYGIGSMNKIIDNWIPPWIE